MFHPLLWRPNPHFRQSWTLVSNVLTPHSLLHISIWNFIPCSIMSPENQSPLTRTLRTKNRSVTIVNRRAGGLFCCLLSDILAYDLLLCSRTAVTSSQQLTLQLRRIPIRTIQNRWQGFIWMASPANSNQTGRIFGLIIKIAYHLQFDLSQFISEFDFIGRRRLHRFCWLAIVKRNSQRAFILHIRVTRKLSPSQLCRIVGSNCHLCARQTYRLR